MGVSRLWCRAEFRQRWLQHLTVALLIGFVGAAVLTCVAAARRTDSTYARYLRTEAIPEVEVSAGDTPPQELAADLRSIDGVRSVGAYDALFAGPDRPDVVPGDNFLLFVPLDDDYARTLDRPIVIDGRMPVPDAANEVVVNERARNDFGLDIGSRFTVQSIASSEAPYVQNAEYDKIKFLGPKPTLRVVGIARARVDLTGSTYVSHYGFATPAYVKKYGDQSYGFGAQVDVRYDDGADKGATTRAIRSRAENAQVLNDGGSALQDTARTQSIALAFIGLTALLAGALVISQAIGRMLRAKRDDLVGLRELGVDRSTAVMAILATFVPAALAGAVIALVGAWIGSRWFPTGLVGRAEVAPGMQVDGFVFALGAVAIIALVVARVAAGAVRTTSTTRPRRVARVSWSDRIAAGLGPAGGTGVRWAVGRAEGRRPLTGLLAAIIGVTGLLAVTTYTRQLDHVVATPSAYGDPSDASVAAGPDNVGEARAAALEHNTVGDVVVYTLASRVRVNDISVQGWAFEDARGHIEPTVVDGRAPARDSEAMIGAKTADQLGVGIGDHVRVAADARAKDELTVVGIGLFPNSETDEIATGIVTTSAVLKELKPDDPQFGVAWRWKPGIDVAAARKQFADEGIELPAGTLPPDIANIRVVRTYPWWLAGFLVVLAMLATTNALVVAARRRRHEMAVLGAIGFSRRQLTEATATQGATVGLLAAFVGVPAGLLAGKWVWTTHADRVGLSTSLVLPIGLALGVGAVTVAITCGMAIVGGWGATRARLATSLRTE